MTTARFSKIAANFSKRSKHFTLKHKHEQTIFFKRTLEKMYFLYGQQMHCKIIEKIICRHRTQKTVIYFFSEIGNIFLLIFNIEFFFLPNIGVADMTFTYVIKMNTYKNKKNQEPLGCSSKAAVLRTVMTHGNRRKLNEGSAVLRTICVVNYVNRLDGRFFFMKNVQAMSLCH
jgi:hypothetical protein